MQGTAEGSGNAKILLKESVRRFEFNAGVCRRLRQCRNLAKRDVQAVDIQCKRLPEAPAMQKSC